MNPDPGSAAMNAALAELMARQMIAALDALVNAAPDFIAAHITGEDTVSICVHPDVLPDEFGVVYKGIAIFRHVAIDPTALLLLPTSVTEQIDAEYKRSMEA